ncbi:DUF4214 domain-containing protein [Telluria beijingensis]|uniref:DUF4214 domain-containing protein n=1 Tax=Telluria beijingensis TaxID=3068633 RepID=UPI00279621CD|nr:DUF4214 domain-containing protein [Massilia sp. REN29]
MSRVEAIVNSFYLGYYGRPADPDGLAFWSMQLGRADGDFDTIAQAFAASEEAAIRFGSADTEARIAQIYQNLFERAPDSEGLAFWTKAIAQGHISMADAALYIARGAQQADAGLLALRQQAVERFTAEVAASGVAYDGYAAIEAARILVKAVGPQASAADIDAMVEATARLVDIAHDNPNVVTAIATGTTLVALFDTARGQSEPVNLVLALADVAQAAAGDPATLESLLRGGGMAKVLQVMPQKATLHDVVEALATGGLPAAVDVVYPSNQGTAPVMPVRLAFLGVQHDEGDAQPRDNVTNVKEARIEFSHSGRALAGGERYEFSLDGSAWKSDGLATSTVGRTTVIAVVVDLGEGAPLAARTRVADSHADLETTVYLRVVNAAGKVVASASQAIVYDSYVAVPVFTLDTDPASLHFGADLHHVRDAEAVRIGGIESGGRIEYAVHDQPGATGAEPSWTRDAPVFVEGENTIEVRQVDAAGNISRSETLTFTLDTMAPAAPTVVLEEDTGIEDDDGITSNARIVIGGLETLLTTGWEYSTDGKEWTFGGVNDGSGSAVFDAAVLGERSSALQVRQIDAAGHVSDAVMLALTYDKTAPGETLSFMRIEGEADGKASTTQPQAGITFGVTGAADGIVQWRFKGDSAWTTLDEDDYNGDGSFTLPAVDLADADPTIEVRVIDAAGNPGDELSQAIDGPWVKPIGATLMSISLGLLGETNTATFEVDGAQLTGLDDAATFVLSDYSSGAPLPTAVDYTAGPDFGVDAGVLTFGQALHAGLYEMGWQDDTFTTDTGYLKAGSLRFAGGSDGLFQFEGVAIGRVAQVTSGGVFDSTNNTAFLVASFNDLNTPYIVGGAGHDVYVKQSRSMAIGIEDYMREGDSDLVVNFESGVDKIRFNFQVALMLDQDYDGEIDWAAPAGPDGRVVIGSTDEGAQATTQAPIRIGSGDTSSIITELNKLFDVTQVARNANLVFLLDDGGIGDGAALFYYINKDDDDRIDADEVTTLLMFADGAPEQADIVVVGTV